THGRRYVERIGWREAETARETLFSRSKFKCGRLRVLIRTKRIGQVTRRCNRSNLEPTLLVCAKHGATPRHPRQHPWWLRPPRAAGLRRCPGRHQRRPDAALGPPPRPQPG